MTGGELAAAIIGGFVLPFIISFMKSAKWSRQTKLGLTALLSLIMAIIVSAATSGIAGGFLIDWGIVFTTASTFYTTILEKSSIEVSLRSTGIK